LIQWEEVLWSVVALVGLGFALFNAREARQDLHAVLRSNQNGARLMWAKFSRLLHITLASVELAFVLVGVIAMFRRPSPDTSTGGQLLLVVLLVGASALLTSVSIMWLRVHVAITKALQRRGSPNDRRSTEQGGET
jgi:heme A synthase